MTRPEPGASQTTEKLRLLGHDPVLLPLTRIIGLYPEPGQLSADRISAIGATSASAIVQWQQSGIEPECLLRPIYVVGERTGQAAQTVGFSDVRIGGGTGEELASLIDIDTQSGRLQLSEAKPILYVAGRVRHPDFESGLSRAMVPTRVVDIYTIEEISYSTDFLVDFFLTRNVDVVLLYSPVASTLFFKKSDQPAIYKHLKKYSFYCMSRAISQVIPDAFRSQIRVADNPDEQSLLSLLGDINAQP